MLSAIQFPLKFKYFISCQFNEIVKYKKGPVWWRHLRGQASPIVQVHWDRQQSFCASRPRTTIITDLK